MAARRDFAGIVEKLQSDKMKDRVEGVARCREFLGNKRNFLSLNNDRNHSWLETLQAIFQVVIIERNAYTAKPTAPNQKRLDEAANLLRYVAEKTHQLLPRKTIKALINHLTQMIAVHGSLQLYALTYLKTLRTVLAYPPHLEHLDERQWTDIVTLCFSGALGDKVKIGQEFADETAMDVDSDPETAPQAALRVIDSDEEEIDQLERARPNPSSTARKGGKRAGSTASSSASSRRTANPTEIELLYTLESVFRCPSSPFLTYASVIFRKFLRFFLHFPTETSAHYPALVALNRALAELDLNDQRSMRRMGPKLWESILALWATKNAGTKEQVLITLRYLTPFVVPRRELAEGGGGGGGDEEAVARTRAKELYQAVLSEPTIRWREAYDLDLDMLRLGVEDGGGAEAEGKAFEGQTFRIGGGFDDRQAVSWMTIELGAMALARIYDAGEETTESQDVEMAVLSPTQRGKRRKVDDPLTLLLDSLSDPALAINVVTFRLKILLLLIDRHWASLSPEACHRILDALFPLLSHLDPQVERWTFLSVAAIAHAGLPVLPTSLDPFIARYQQQQKEAPAPWDQIWGLALRRLTASEICRSAAHTANVLLAHGRVSPLLLTDSIDNFAKDLDIQGLAFPSDTVCLFLEWTLAIAASDSRLFRIKLKEKVLSWVTTAWKPLDGIHRAHTFGQTRPHADPFTVDGLVKLLARLSSIAVRDVPKVPHEVFVPDCPVATVTVELSETKRVRDYIDAKVPLYVRDEAAGEAMLRTPAYYDAAGGGAALDDQEVGGAAKKISQWLVRTLEGFQADASGGGALHWSGMASDLARRHLDFASLSLFVEALFTANKLPSSGKVARSASSIFTSLAPTLALKKWSPAERAHLLAGLGPILVSVPGPQAIEYPVLLDPAPSSAIPIDLLPHRSSSSSTSSSNTVDLNSLEISHLRTLWKLDGVSTALDEILTALRFILSEATESPTPSAGSYAATQSGSGGGATQASQRIKELEQTQAADDFGEVRISSRAPSVLGGGGGGGGGLGGGETSLASGTGGTTASRAGTSIVLSCLRGFISSELASSATLRPVRLQEVVDVILSPSTSGNEGILIASALFTVSLSGIVRFGLAQAEALLQHLGEDLLPDYRYARGERFAATALTFLECTLGLWVNAEWTEREEFAGDARTLISWYIGMQRSKKMASWRVRLQFIAFLDKYIEHDPLSQFWDLGGDMPRDEDGKVFGPTAIVPALLSDVDFRVRVRAASSSPALFEAAYHLGVSGDKFFKDIQKNFPKDIGVVEEVLTSTLCLANVVITAGSHRRIPYHQLLDIAGGENASVYSTYVVASLEGVAARLGYKTLADLYLQYARFLAWIPRRGKYGITPEYGQLRAFEACGFPTLRDARRADFKQTASIYLCYEEDSLAHFRTMCDVLKRSEQQGRLDCLPETLSLVIVQWFEDHAEDVNPPVGILQAKLNIYAEAAGAGDAHQQEKLIDSVIDEVFAEIIALTFDNVVQSDVSHTTLSLVPGAVETFSKIIRLNEPLHLLEAIPVVYSVDVTMRACHWLDREKSVLVDPAVVFSVVHNLFGKINRAHFIPDQQRQVINLAFAISLCHRTVGKERGILAALGDGLIRLLPESDLLNFVGPFVRWTFNEWTSFELKRPDAREQDRVALSEQLVRAAHVCVALEERCSREGDESTSAGVKVVRQTLESNVRALIKFSDARCASVALLWPSSSPFPFSVFEPIRETLSSSFAPVSKFGIASLLLQRDDRADILKRRDIGSILWRLMESIGPQDELKTADVSAFADLLYESGGVAETPDVDELSASYMATTEDSSVDGEKGIKKLVAKRVLERLDGSDPLLIGAAFSTAKLVFSVPTVDRLFAKDQLSLVAINAGYLSSPVLQRPLRLRPRLQRTLAELQADDLISGAKDISTWVKQVAELLADARAEGDDFYAQVVPLVQLNTDFAKDIVPYLVHSTLLQNVKTGNTESQHISVFFQRVLASKGSSVEALRLIVDTAIYLRKHARPDLAPTAAARFDSWLSVPWVDLASGAVKTGAYLAGFLFLELAHEYDGLFDTSPNQTAQNIAADEQGQALLYEIYAQIDEPDGFYGRETPDVRQALLLRYRHEGNWNGAFRAYGAQHEAQSFERSGQGSLATAGVVTSLASFGFNRLAMGVYQPARLEGTLKAQDVPAALPYELAWRTDVWDLPIEQQAAASSSVSLYSALRATRNARSLEAARTAAQDAIKVEAKKLSGVTLDLPRPNNDALSTILALREVDRLAGLKQNDRLAPELVASISSVPALAFYQAERVLTSRISILRGIRTKEAADQVSDEFRTPVYIEATAAERACLIELSTVARRSGQLQAAFNTVTLAHTLIGADPDDKGLDVDEEFANVLWAQGEHVVAISLLDTVLKTSRSHQSANLAANLARLGAWTAEARMRNPDEILSTCFDPAVRSLDRSASPAERAHVFHSYAAFADDQYEALQVSAVEKRARFEKYKARKEIEFEEIDQQLTTGSMSSGQLEKSKKDARAHIEEDRRALEEMERTTQSMLVKAVENYAKALAASNEHDDKVFRLVGLWLANADADQVHKALKSLLKHIPSYKFVFLAFQLSARLAKSSSTSGGSVSSSNIRTLVLRLCIEHPYHAIYPVNALREATLGKSSRRSSSARPLDANTGKDGRGQAASEILEKVKGKDGMQETVEAIELALDAYAEWAEYNLKDSTAYTHSSSNNVRKGPLPLLNSSKIKRQVVDLPIPVTTYDLPVNVSGRYDQSSFPTIVRYRDTFDTAGGINLPKIMTCIGSDGKEYKQLMKGNDDIRQDAVMEQLFTLINDLLSRDEGGRRRKLHIRTYKIVPLQRRNGLIEFAANTTPLGNCLSRLYEQMAPGKAQDARKKLAEPERTFRSHPEEREREKRKIFSKVMETFPPLLRHLFWQKHKVPSLWFDMRLNYARSVAVNSITGHVAGLGDRHVSNILIDEARGELVHIDFGIAFEGGRRLPIPELVPFRLTHNIVDGFGMSGVNGVFRRCSEETLRVLRERSSVLMTILEVFKHDPLQNWAVSADMAKRRQETDEQAALELDELPDDADRALNIVRGKLDNSLSVQYTVNDLIAKATDPDNLAVIFSGWQPYY